MELKIDRVKAFKKWLDTPKRLKIAFGGRGGGKSESIIRMLLVLSFIYTDCTFLFARETQKSVEHSSYPLLVNLISKMN